MKGRTVCFATEPEVATPALMSANYAPIDRKEKKIERGTKFSGTAVRKTPRISST